MRSYCYKMKHSGLVKALLSVLLLVCSIQNMSAQFTFTNDLKGSKTTEMVVGGGGGTQGTAYLTSGGVDPVGAGWLRLNNSTTNQRGYFYVDKSFPSTLGVLVDFEYKMWRNNANTSGEYYGGDGFSVFLFDATVPFKIGGYGGSLGYARLVGGPTPIDGLAGGYVGIGFDAYGNYGNNNEGKPGRIALDANNDANGLVPNTVILRGPTTSNTATSNRYLAGYKVGDRSGTSAAIRQRNEIDYNTSPFNETRPTDAQFYRRVQVEIDPTGTGFYDIIIRWKRNISDTGFTELVRYTTNEIPPSLLKLGFAASTGGAFNYHEIRNVMITTPGNLRVVKKADKDILRSVPSSNPANQNQITYSIEVTNDTDATLTNINFNDEVKDGQGNTVTGGTSGMFRITSITHSGFTSASLPAPSAANPLATNQITGSLNMAAKTTGIIRVTGTLTAVPLGNVLVNTASALPSDILDQDLDNNTSIVTTPVIAEGIDMTIDQTTDKPCVDSSNGNTLTVTPANMGNGNVEYGGTTIETTGNTNVRNYYRNRVEVTEIVPPNTTLVSSSIPSGWTLVQTAANSPSAGYTSYVYRTSVQNTSTTIANSLSLTSGQSMTPFTFTIKGTSQFTNQARVRFIQEKGTVTRPNSGGTWTTNAPTDITDLEPPLNVNSNNASSFTVNSVPDLPVIEAAQQYCIGQVAALSASTTNSNYVLNWYTTVNGFRLANAPVPPTSAPGIYKYYVSQSNGVCEGPLKEITVTVKNCKVLTNPILINRSVKR